MLTYQKFSNKNINIGCHERQNRITLCNLKYGQYICNRRSGWAYSIASKIMISFIFSRLTLLTYYIDDLQEYISFPTKTQRPNTLSLLRFFFFFKAL
jgi:hypothetical protein